MRRPASQNSIRVRPLSVAELAAVLTETLARLSPTRLSIVSDQLRAILHSGRPSDLLAIAALPGVDAVNRADAQNGEDSLSDGIIAIAALPEHGDTGTILHVDWARPGATKTDNKEAAGFARRASVPLRDHMLDWMFDRGVRLVQWATDPNQTSPDEIPVETVNPGISEWAELMQFENIGTLDYLAGETFKDALPCPDLSPEPDSLADSLPDSLADPDSIREPGTPAIVLTPLDHHSLPQTKDFETLVSMTYEGSLDCPNLESHRSTHQILESYRCVSSFAADLWFVVHLVDRDTPLQPNNAVGCCLLARHANSESQELVLELVYMGIVPSHRGKGLGRKVMQQISKISRQQNAVRLVLAVDQNNHPALAAYERFGMKPLFSETVWVRSL